MYAYWNFLCRTKLLSSCDHFDTVTTALRNHSHAVCGALQRFLVGSPRWVFSLCRQLFRRAFVRVQIVAKLFFSHLWAKLVFSHLWVKTKKNYFRRDFVRSPFLLFSGGILYTRQSCLAKVSFFSFVGKVSFFSFVGQNKKKYFRRDFVRCPFLVFSGGILW